MLNIPAHVQRKLDEVQQKNLTELDVSIDHGSGLPKLTSIPPQVFELHQLKTLKLGNNHIQELPIELFQLTNLIFLDLSRNRLTELPDSFGDFTNLTFLDLSSNILRKLPDSFGDFTNLTFLSLDYNPIKKLPDSMNSLHELSKLSLINCHISDLPEWIGGLTKLRELLIGSNDMNKLPQSLCVLSNLEHLDLSGCSLHELPIEIQSLEKLTTLDLSGNSLTSLPDWFIKLQELRDLRLRHNNFMTIPSVVFSLKNLESLYLNGEGNHIKSIPIDIVKLKKLSLLLLDLGTIESPPPEIFKHDGLPLDKLQKFFRQLKKEGSNNLYEAKLLILGESGAGKTSFARKIRDNSYQLEPKAPSTRGIDVHPWLFHQGKKFQVNIWDFGGQTIYHNTHQFFLTKRLLYILIADNRIEDTDFYYWLNLVELLSEGSPIIIVKNEKQNHHKDIGESQLRQRFGNIIKEIMATDLSTNRGLDQIIKEIKHQITNLSHMGKGSQLPKTWIKVRKALDRDHRNYISFDEYVEFCKRAGIMQHDLRIQLIDFLNDIGVCLHFREDPILKHYVILKPKWGTDAVYQVLDNENVRGNQGRFTTHDLAAIWNDEQYTNMQDALLQLMIKFGICYEIPGPPKTHTYIASQLLPVDRPTTYTWDDSDSTIIRYTYDGFMPKGIIARFIADININRLIEGEGSTVWKTGVVISNGYARAEIIEMQDQHEIRIRLNGEQKMLLLGIVFNALDMLHASFPRLDYKKLIPCNCSLCLENPTPHFYTFDFLIRSVKLRKQVQCYESYKMLDPHILLENVRGTGAAEADSYQSEEPPTSLAIATKFLMARLGSENMRRALLTTAFLGQDTLIASIDFSGNALAFTSSLIKDLQAYGTVSQGRQALWQLLETLREHVGIDQQEVIDSLKSWANAPH